LAVGVDQPDGGRTGVFLAARFGIEDMDSQRTTALCTSGLEAEKERYQQVKALIVGNH
jgi:hypothetical protein